jgi:hypothetical protein
MDWSMNICGDRHFISGARDGDDMRHIALKLLGVLAMGDVDAISEPKRRSLLPQWRGIRPDILSRDGRRWVECGRTSMDKLEHLMTRRDLDEVLVMCYGRQNDPSSSRLSRSRAKHPRGAVLRFHIWNPEDVDWISKRLMGSNDVEGKMTKDGLLLSLNGERCLMRLERMNV